MADLTTIETQLINKGSPLSNDFSLGSRMQNMTTDGNYSSGTLDTPSLTDWNPPDATGSLSSAYWTTAGGLTAGAWNTTWAYIRIDTALDTGTVITITNLATATTVICQLSSAADAGSPHMGTATAFRMFTIQPTRTVSIMNHAATVWIPLGDTGNYSSWGVATA